MSEVVRDEFSVRVTFVPPFDAAGPVERRARPEGFIERNGRSRSFAGWMELVAALEDDLRAAAGENTS